MVGETDGETDTRAIDIINVGARPNNTKLGVACYKILYPPLTLNIKSCNTYVQHIMKCMYTVEPF